MRRRERLDQLLNVFEDRRGRIGHFDRRVFKLKGNEENVEFEKEKERRTPGRIGEGPRMSNVMFSAANASLLERVLFDEAVRSEVNSIGSMVLGTGMSCVALMFVRPGRPSKAGRRTEN